MVLKGLPPLFFYLETAGTVVVSESVVILISILCIIFSEFIIEDKMKMKDLYFCCMSVGA